jgi:hypothetical protein
MYLYSLQITGDSPPQKKKKKKHVSKFSLLEDARLILSAICETKFPLVTSLLLQGQAGIPDARLHYTASGIPAGDTSPVLFSEYNSEGTHDQRNMQCKEEQ